MMAGISTLGLRVLDVLRAYDYLTSRADSGSGPIALSGVGDGAIFAYLAAALEPGWAEVTLERMLLSYRSLVETRYYERRLFNLRTMAWGFLARFDLPDLAACIAPRPLRFMQPLNAYGELVSRDPWEQVWVREPEAAGSYPGDWRPVWGDTPALR
jgi:hypothetical protein